MELTCENHEIEIPMNIIIPSGAGKTVSYSYSSVVAIYIFCIGSIASYIERRN